MIPERIEKYSIPFGDIAKIKEGNDWISLEGKVIPHSVLTTPAPLPRSYAYCSDTLYSPDIVSHISSSVSQRTDIILNFRSMELFMLSPSFNLSGTRCTTASIVASPITSVESKGESV